MLAMGPLRILILSDGRAGHFNISEGLATALSRRFRTEVRRSEVRRGAWSSTILAPVSNVAGPNSPISSRWILKRIYGLDPDSLPEANLIISAGAETLAANACLAQIRQIPNIFYGSLRLFSPSLFSLALTSYERQVKYPNQAMALKPSRFDADRFQRPPLDPNVPPATAGLLIGGNTGTIRFTDQDWQQLLQFVADTNHDTGIAWTITNSRRTPDSVSDQVAKQAGVSGSGIERFVDVRDPATGTLDDVFAASDIIMCTNDSSTMLSEAVQLRRPVIGLTPARFQLTPNEMSYRDYLERQGWVRSFELQQIDPHQVLSAIKHLTPMQTDALDQMADLIVTHIPELANFAH